MATTTKQSLDALIKRVRDADWEVVDMGMRWRVTNPAGGGPLFIPKRPPKSNTLKPVTDLLAQHGWNEYEVEQAAEQARQQKITADRERNEARMRQAQEYAEQQARIAAEQAEQNLLNGPALAKGAVDIGRGHKKAILDIDGDFAQELLKHNAFFDPERRATAPIGRCNRPFDKALAHYYKNVILRGEWELTHQGIAFDKEWFMLDGQHRLVGLMWAAEENPDVVIETEVTYDLPSKTMDVIDTGKRRTPTDVLALHRYANRQVLAAAVKLLHKYDEVDPADWWSVRLSNPQMLAMIDKYGPELIDAVRRSFTVNKIVHGSAAAAFIYLAERVYPHAPMDDFLYGLRTGVDLGQGDTRHSIRSFSESSARKRRRVTNEEWLAWLIKGWNNFLLDRRVSAKWMAHEPFPRPIERG
jgi:hypothetical protein